MKGYDFWTQAEEEKLKEIVYNCTSFKEMGRILNKKSGTIKEKLERMGIDISSGNNWTPEEESLLRDCIGKSIPYNDMARMLKRTKFSIYKKCKFIKRDNLNNQKRWSEEDVLKLKQLIDKGLTLEEISGHFDRTPHSLSVTVRRLGLKLYKKESTFWSEDKFNKLKELHINNKSVDEIVYELRLKDLYYYEEFKFPENDYKTISNLILDGLEYKDIAKQLNIPLLTIRGLAQRNNLQLKSFKQFSEIEVSVLKFLIENNYKMKEIVKIMARSRPSIRNKIDSLFKNNRDIPDIYISFLDSCDFEFNRTLVNEKLRQAKLRSNAVGIDFNLTEQDIYDLLKSQDYKCFYSGRKLSIQRNNPRLLSMDRLDSNKGYTKDNIVLCVSDINIMKNKHSVQYFLKTCKEITEYMSQNKPSFFSC